MAYESILTCAIMARDIYGDASSLGWKRVAHAGNKNGGFWGEALTDGKGAVIVAVRGTQEMQDFLDDANMIPLISGNVADLAMRKLVVAYCKGTPAHAVLQHADDAANITAAIFKMKANSSMKDWGNKIPEEQAKFARVLIQRTGEYCRANKARFRCFTGHSLGGAMAQYMSQQTGSGALGVTERIPAVAFNAPNMGTMAGMKKGSGGAILCVNARLDPLSLATKLAGNETHAKNENYYIPVEVDAFRPPPQVSKPVTDGQRVAFFKWFGQAAGHYHSMGTLVNALCSKSPGNVPLHSYFH